MATASVRLAQKPAATSWDNGQGKDSFMGLALIRDILLRACGRVFRRTTLLMDFVSVKRFQNGSAKAPTVIYLLIYWFKLPMKATLS